MHNEKFVLRVACRDNFLVNVFLVGCSPSADDDCLPNDAVLRNFLKGALITSPPRVLHILRKEPEYGVTSLYMRNIKQSGLYFRN